MTRAEGGSGAVKQAHAKCNKQSRCLGARACTGSIAGIHVLKKQKKGGPRSSAAPALQLRKAHGA